MTRFGAPLPRDVIKYPELLRRAGYFTGDAGRIYHLDGAFSPLNVTKQVYEKYDLKTFPRRLDFVRVSRNNTVLPPVVEFLDALPGQALLHSARLKRPAPGF